MSSVDAPMTGVRSMAAATFPASLRVGTITLTLALRGTGARQAPYAIAQHVDAVERERASSPGARTRYRLSAVETPGTSSGRSIRSSKRTTSSPVMSKRLRKSASDSQFACGAGRFRPPSSASRIGTSHR